MTEPSLPVNPPPRRPKADINVPAEDAKNNNIGGNSKPSPAKFCEWHLPAMFEAKYIDPFSVPAGYLREQVLEKEKLLVEELDNLLKEEQQDL